MLGAMGSNDDTPNDWPMSPDSCPECGGEVRITLLGSVAIDGQEHWKQSGHCLRCGTSLGRPLSQIEEPARDMQPDGPWQRQ